MKGVGGHDISFIDLCADLCSHCSGPLKRKEWREFAAFLVMYAIAFGLGLMYVLDIPIPSPMKGLQYLISDKLGLKYPQK